MLDSVLKNLSCGSVQPPCGVTEPLVFPEKLFSISDEWMMM